MNITMKTQYKAFMPSNYPRVFQELTFGHNYLYA